MKKLLASPTICKVCWDCKEALEELIRQEHTSETQVQTLVDAQQMFLSDKDNMLPLSQVTKDARNEMLQRRSGQTFYSKEKVSSSAQSSVSVCDWTEEDWDHLLRHLSSAPDWDRYHAYNERAVRRPFAQSFLKHAAAHVLAMQVPRKRTNFFHLFKSSFLQTVFFHKAQDHKVHDGV